MGYSREFLEEQKYIGLYKKFMQENPEAYELGKYKKREKFLRSHGIKKGSHIWNFFMDKRNENEI